MDKENLRPMQQPQSWPKPWPKPVTRKDPCEAFEERLTSAIELGKAQELLPIFSEYFDWAEENCPTKEPQSGLLHPAEAPTAVSAVS